MSISTPCHLESLPFIKIGTVSMSMRMILKGVSIRRAVKTSFPMKTLVANPAFSKLNGPIAIEAPLTSMRLKRLAPQIFPTESEPCPLISEVIAVTSSGSDVPSAIKVRAITVSGTPSASAIIIPLSTRKSAPKAMHVAPPTSKTSSS